MDSKQLKVFLEVARQSSFTKASEKLRIAQPAVSIAIRKLEEELEVKLFNRKDKKVTLTAEGEVLLDHAEEVLAQLKDAELAMEEMRGMEKGRVRVGIPTMLGSYYFPNILIGFKKQYPKLAVSIIEDGARSIQNMISSGLIDMGSIVVDDVPDNLEVREYLREEMVVCVSPDHPFAKRKRIQYDEFAKEDLILFNEGYFQRELITKLGEKFAVEPNIVFETNLIPLIVSLVRENLGITTFLKMVIKEKEGIVAVPFDPPLIVRLGLAWKKNHYLSRANQSFVEFLLRAEG